MNSCWRTFVAIALIWASEVFLVHADGNSTAEESTTPKVTTSLPPKDEDLLGDTYQPTQNYCDPSLCENKVHVACERHKSRKLITEYYSKACPRAARWLALEDDTKTLILDTINGMRDKVAHGGFDAFLPAIRMASVQWDDELAYIAKHNVLKCRLHRDHCRNTARYKNVGQTVAFREVRPGRGDTTDKAIVRMIQLWFKEHEVATMADMEAYKGRHGRRSSAKERRIEIITSNHEVDVEVIPEKYQQMERMVRRSNRLRSAKRKHGASHHAHHRRAKH
ncbi:antigen 5 like allergen Cul n 1 isoform X2 [Drosophila sulfurigaster albostrigata]|uniref:antigen 5 like allergen Cul n 1 isoform X2 n=1 Tax=Drosophila sulfurigaster albostrigata TaxID=89887 RepID=UPI002D21889D|nr:antigen 5 like allergen Cul n 1 isoform X2 [Drosophila sulfurigaster albostrigata]